MIEFPPDLPEIIQYRLRTPILFPGTFDRGVTTRVALPRRQVQFIGSSGVSDAYLVCVAIPPGADAWRVPAGDWQPLSNLPAAWMPFLNRQRGGEMDARK